MENRDVLAQQSPLSLNIQPFFQEIQGHRKEVHKFLVQSRWTVREFSRLYTNRLSLRKIIISFTQNKDVRKIISYL